MAIQLMQENGEYNIKSQHFLIDETSDLTSLENEYSCSMGDKAELPNGIIYVRHSDEFDGDLWELKEKFEPINPFPTIYSDDNGKILGVEDENWALINLPKELPDVNSDDIGKIAVVKDAPTGEFEIVPFQNIEIEDLNEGYDLSNINNSYVAIGAECFIKIEMDEYIGAIDDNFHLNWGDNSEYIDFNTGKIYLNSVGYYAVQVSTLGTKYYWDKKTVENDSPIIFIKNEEMELPIIDGIPMPIFLSESIESYIYTGDFEKLGTDLNPKFLLFNLDNSWYPCLSYQYITINGYNPEEVFNEYCCLTEDTQGIEINNFQNTIILLPSTASFEKGTSNSSPK